WEKYVAENRERLAAVVAARQVSRWRQYPQVAQELFPPPAFGPAEEILGGAAQAAAGDPEAGARVQFLQNGLAHAQLCTKAASVLASHVTADASTRRQALDELVAFRRAVEGDNIANMGWLAYVEGRSWVL